jgi:predicted GTPase
MVTNDAPRKERGNMDESSILVSGVEQSLDAFAQAIERQMQQDALPVDYEAEAAKSRDEVLRELGHVNVLVAGRTGVGKSTLVNAVFQFDEAKVGSGEPVTMHVKKYQKPEVPLAIWDSRGLEMADYRSIIDELKREVERRNSDADYNNHIHVAWLCIHEDGRRVEPAERSVHEMLAESMPVIAVITKAREDRGFEAEVRRLLPQAKNVVRVRALSDEFGDGENERVTLAPMNVTKLVAITKDALPPAHRRAFLAAQWADIGQKVDAAKAVLEDVKNRISTATDPRTIQIAMLEKISSIFQVSLSLTRLADIIDKETAPVNQRLSLKE